MKRINRIIAVILLFAVLACPAFSASAGEIVQGRSGSPGGGNAIAQGQIGTGSSEDYIILAEFEIRFVVQ